MKYKAKLMLCGKEEHNFIDECCSPLPDYTVARMVTCMCLQHFWEKEFSDFDGALRNVWLVRPVHDELPDHVYSYHGQDQSMMTVNWSLVEFKDEARA